MAREACHPTLQKLWPKANAQLAARLGRAAGAESCRQIREFPHLCAAARQHASPGKFSPFGASSPRPGESLSVTHSLLCHKHRFRELSPQALLTEARRYWSVEKKNHWKRDAVWREDQARVRDSNSARTLVS